MREKLLRFKGIKVSILGYGRTGKALAVLMDKLGAKVFVSNLGKSAELESSGFEFEVGGHSDKVLDCDLMLPSPGIPPSAEIIQKAIKRGIEVRGEIDFSAELLPCSYVSITGTSGKSTTTSLIAKMLNSAGIVSHAIGNIGDPIANHVLSSEPDWVPAIEVGSPMCEMMESFHPKVGVFLNLSEDHLDRHGTMEVYASMKEKILRFMTEKDSVVLNLGDEWSRSLADKTPAKKLLFSPVPDKNADVFMDGEILVVNNKKVASITEFVLSGSFNGQNILASALACSHFGISMIDSVNAVKNFQPLQHRMQFVGEWGGVKFINDSKATKPNATVLALETLKGKFVLILGGSEKGSDFSVLKNSLGNVKMIVVHGATKDRIIETLVEAGFKNYIKVKDQREAIESAINNSRSGDTVLLSPACASFDQFKDFEQRGNEFSREVKLLAPQILGS